MTSVRVLKSREGALQLALALALGTVAASAFACFAIGEHWTRQVRLQLAIDRCAGQASLELRDRLNTLEQLNRRLHVLRVATKAALVSGNPSIISAARAATQGIAQLQALEFLKWKRRQIGWVIGSECRSNSLRGLPDLPFHRPPPDTLGASPLEWKPSQAREFSIRVLRARRGSEAFVFFSPAGEWIASWRRPPLEQTH